MFKIALAQYPIHYYKTEQDWLSNIDKWYNDAKADDGKILVFPEYASMELVSLFKGNETMTLNQQLEKIQELHKLFLDLHIQMSIKHSVYSIAPSFPLFIKSKFVNRTYVISPEGKYDFQDKIHMTRFEEDWGISPGETELRVFNTKLGKFAIQICFDIEFAWAAGLLAESDTHLILAPSCTESIHGMNRVHIGARARALENQMYIGVSQVVGMAPWSHAVDKNNGIAALYGPVDLTFPEDGILAEGKLNEPKWIVCEIDISKLDFIRNNGQVLNFKHNSKYQWNQAKDKNLKLKTITF